jgi:hypothetical protein
MPRGRPNLSIVRDRLAEMLFIAGKLTAYEAHKHYINIFANTTRRNVYYQLTKGEALGVFDKEIVDEQGKYSWGDRVRKIYYFLKSKDNIQVNIAIKKYFEELRKCP